MWLTHNISKPKPQLNPHHKTKEVDPHINHQLNLTYYNLILTSFLPLDFIHTWIEIRLILK